jgi:hypothetical protein
MQKLETQKDVKRLAAKFTESLGPQPTVHYPRAIIDAARKYGIIIKQEARK